MKKAFLIGCLFMAAFESYAAEKHMRKDEPQITLPKTASVKQMQECATATTTYQGETIVCYRVQRQWTDQMVLKLKLMTV